MITVTCRGKQCILPDGARYADAAAFYQDMFEEEILLACSGFEKHPRELFRVMHDGEEVDFLTYRAATAARAYRRTAALLLKIAVEEVFGKTAEMCLEFNLGGNFFAGIRNKKPTSGEVDRIRKIMKELAEADLPLVKESLPCSKAMQILEEAGQSREARFLHYRQSSRVNIYYLQGKPCYFVGRLCSRTGAVRRFDLIPYDAGMLLVLPGSKDPEKLNPVAAPGKHFFTQIASQDWAERVGISNLTDFNDRIVEGTSDRVILMQEARFEKQLGDVAERVIRDGRKFIFLAGPSSSGKTTTAYRIGIQLRAFGVEPRIISADDYFTPVAQRPLLPDGSPDLESIRAVDVELFNSDMVRLLSGETVELPEFNFVTQDREYRGKKITLTENTVLIVEGIHCLNPIFSQRIPKEKKLKLFVSAMTPLCISDMNPIATSDCRLLRRMIRDHRTRGRSAEMTIAGWDEVRKGEEENIFPFQEEADITLNSAMIYELSALKTYVEPLLFGIEPDSPQYDEARRLLKFLSFVLSIPNDLIPATSILREFIGGSRVE